VSVITPDELMALVPRLAKPRPAIAWQRVRGLVGPSPVEQSRPGRSEELTGFRPAREDDPWKIVVWSQWLTRRHRVVRDYREVVPAPGCALIDDRPGLLSAGRTSRFAALLTFTALARALLSGEPACLLTLSGQHRHGFDRPERLRGLAEVVANMFQPSRSQRGLTGRPTIQRIVDEEIPANSVCLAILAAEVGRNDLLATCEALSGAHLRSIIYVPFDERELAAPGLTMRGVRSGRALAPASDYRQWVGQHLDRMLKTGDRKGVPIEPLAIGDSDQDVWEVLSTSWGPHWQRK
jgi:hypothetical protein